MMPYETALTFPFKESETRSNDKLMSCKPGMLIPSLTSLFRMISDVKVADSDIVATSGVSEDTSTPTGNSLTDKSKLIAAVSEFSVK